MKGQKMGSYDFFTTKGFERRQLDLLGQIQYYAKKTWTLDDSLASISEGLGFLTGQPSASHVYEDNDVFLRIWQVSETFDQSKNDVVDFISRQVGKQNLDYFLSKFVFLGQLARPDGLSDTWIQYSLQDSWRRIFEHFILDGARTICRVSYSYPLDGDNKTSSFWGGLTFSQGGNYFVNSIVINDKNAWR